MSASRPRSLLALAALLAALASATTALADGAGEADKHFKHGVTLYKENDYAAALAEFQRAYEIQPSWQVLYNIGESQFQLQDYANALKTLQRYLNEGGAKIGAKRKKDVDKDLEKLKQRVATLTVVTNEPGAAVTIDDVASGTTPMAEPVLVSAGKRKVTATLSGRPPATEVVQLAGGDDKTVTLTIAALPPPTKIIEVTKPSPSLMVPLIAWVGTGLLTTAAVTTGVLALGASGDLKDKLAAFPGNQAAINSAHGKAVGLGVATDVLTITALAGAGVATWLTIRAVRPAASDAPPPTAPTARLVPMPGGVALVGTF